MPRPTKLTPDRAKRIIDLVKVGNTRSCAAACAGISEATLYTWIQRGREADPGDENDAIYVEFSEAIERADAEAEAFHVTNVRRHSEKSYGASTWWLETRRRDTYAKRVEHVGDAGGPVRVEVVFGGLDDHSE